MEEPDKIKAYLMSFQPDQAAVTSQPEQLTLLGKACAPVDSRAVKIDAEIFIVGMYTHMNSSSITVSTR